jgi:hypothetical protein
MDAGAMSVLAVPAAVVAGCIALYFGFRNALRRAGSESRRRLVARAAVVTWATFTVLTFAIALAALDALPRWVPAAGLAAAFAVSMAAAQRARRCTMRRRGFA